MNFFRLDYLNVINSTSRDFFESIRSEHLTKVFIFITDLGNPLTVSSICLVFLMLLWLHKKTGHMFQFLITLLTTALVIFLTKEIVQLPRPTGGLITETGYSFASGHSMFATVFFGLVFYSYKNHIKNRSLRILFLTLSGICVLAIGISRVYLGVHYMTDVLAGFFIGTVITGLSVILHQKHRI